jgi:hypothetical protein
VRHRFAIRLQRLKLPCLSVVSDAYACAAEARRALQVRRCFVSLASVSGGERVRHGSAALCPPSTKRVRDCCCCCFFMQW